MSKLSEFINTELPGYPGYTVFDFVVAVTKDASSRAMFGSADQTVDNISKFLDIRETVLFNLMKQNHAATTISDTAATATTTGAKANTGNIDLTIVLNAIRGIVGDITQDELLATVRESPEINNGYEAALASSDGNAAAVRYLITKAPMLAMTIVSKRG